MISPLWFLSAAKFVKDHKQVVLVFAIVALVVTSHLSAYALGRSHGKASIEAAAREATEEDRIRREAAAAKADEVALRSLIDLHSEFSTLTGRLTHETTDPAYRCRPRADGLQLLNAGRAAASKAASGGND